MADKFFSSLLINTCSIFKRTLTGTSPIGEKEYSHTLVSANTKCRIQPVKDAALLSTHGQFEVDRFFAYFEISVDIKRDYIVLYKGKEYAVVGEQDEAGSSHHQKVIIESLSQND